LDFCSLSETGTMASRVSYAHCWSWCLSCSWSSAAVPSEESSDRPSECVSDRDACAAELVVLLSLFLSAGGRSESRVVVFDVECGLLSTVAGDDSS